MDSFQITQAADSSGTLHVTVPGQDPNREYHVVVHVEPAKGTDVPRDEHGWPVGFFERLGGSWEGDFVEQCEGDFEKRIDF